MQYVAPYGVSDPDGGYINGDSRVGIQGSIPPAAAFEHPMRELVALIENSGITPAEDDLEQVTKAIRSQRINYAVDTGSANAMSVAYDPAFVSLTVGLPLRVLVAHNNTGAATITVNNLTATTIRRGDGSTLEADDLVAGEVVTLVYDGTYFQIVNYLGYGAEVQNNNYYDVNIPYTNDSSVTPNTITAIFSPAITTLDAGDLILVKIANANTGATTITVNALPSKSVKQSNLNALVANQIVVGMIAMMVYDGTQFQLLNPALAQTGGAVVAQIAKRYVYQDPNYHLTTVYNSYVEAFRITYTPVTAANKLHIQCVGAFFSGSADATPARGVAGYIAYSVDGGGSWNPSAWPGRDFPAVGTFTANTAQAELQESPSGGLCGIYHNFNIIGQLTVPAGPPSIIIKVMFASSNTLNPTTMMLGGSVLEVTEYTL